MLPRDETWSPADLTPLAEHVLFWRPFNGLSTAQFIILTLNYETQGVYNQLDLSALGHYFSTTVLCTFILLNSGLFFTLLPVASIHFLLSL